LDNTIRATHQALDCGTGQGLKRADKSSASLNHKRDDRPALGPLLTRGTSGESVVITNG